MATTVSTDKLSSNLKVKAFDFDPDGTDPTDIGWEDMRGFGTLMVMFIRTVGTGALDTFEILANSASDGGGTEVTVKAHAVGSEPDAAGDYIVLECSAAEIKDLEPTCRYVSVSGEFATGTDEGVVVYVFGDAKRAYDGLTTDTIA